VSRIPLVDLALQHAEIRDEVEAGIRAVMESGAFILGPQVDEFEAAFADFCGATHCVGVANGTDALELALRALGVGAGDEVILPANTFIATAEAVALAGARPVLVDCAPGTQLIDVDQAVSAIGPATKALVPVHLFGQLAPMAPLLDAARERGVAVLEDAAQSQGATQDGARSGSLGDVAGTSFYPGKNLGAYGDAGAITTSSDRIAESLRAMRNHGGEARYRHDVLGRNSRLDTIQAVVLRAKLRRLEAWNAQRREAAARYASLLGEIGGVELPVVHPGNEHVWHLYVVQVDARDEVVAALQAAGIGVGIHYPIPVHRQRAFAQLSRDASFPVAERAAARILSLPMYPGITPEQQERVAAELTASLVSHAPVR
jgi:dTDP-4-amino-4,6-dideoxygalactose transaminase